jgi:hypothetical protein
MTMQLTAPDLPLLRSLSVISHHVVAEHLLLREGRCPGDRLSHLYKRRHKYNAHY